jgi:hypothetical protein
MVNKDCTNKEDVAINKAIEFNNRDNDNNNNNKDNDDNAGNNNLYIKVATKKRRKKRVRSIQMTLKKTKSVATTKHNKKADIRITHQSTLIL